MKPAQQAAPSPGRPRPPGTAAVSTTAVVGDADEDDDQQQPNLAGDETQRLPPLCQDKIDSADHSNNPARSPKSGETLHLLAPSAGSYGPSGGCGRGRGFGPARVASPSAGARVGAGALVVPATGHCVEDVVESGRAHPFVLNRAKSKLKPLGLSKQDEREFEEYGGVPLEDGGGVFREPLDGKDSTSGPGSKLQAHRRHRRHRPPAHHHHHHRHHHRRASQEMERCSTWTASGQTDATATFGSDDSDNSDDDDDDAARLKCGSVGSGTDRCSETADVGCEGCSSADGNEVPVREQQTREAAGVVSSVSSLLTEQETTATTAASGTATGGSERLTEEAVVRVSELPDVCAICLGQYATGEEVHVLPCLHIFHAEVKRSYL